jgi:ABC-type iron transport system FetAB permease component
LQSGVPTRQKILGQSQVQIADHAARHDIDVTEGVAEVPGLAALALQPVEACRNLRQTSLLPVLVERAAGMEEVFIDELPGLLGGALRQRRRLSVG